MIIKVTDERCKAVKGKFACEVQVEGHGVEIAAALEALITDLLKGGMPDCLVDIIVAKAKDRARDIVYTDTDSVKYSDNTYEKCKEFIYELLADLERSKKRRREDD